MWKCDKCNTENQGLFCSNCGAPMTEEGEKLDIAPVTYDAVETVSEPKLTFKDVLLKAVTSRQYLIVTILYTVGFGYNLLFGSGFNVISLLLMIGLYMIRGAAKDGFSKGARNFSLVSTANVICAVVAIIAAVAILVSATLLTGVCAVAGEEVESGITAALEYKNGAFVIDEMNNPATEELFTEVSQALGIDKEDIGAFLVDNLDKVGAIMWIMALAYIGYCVLVAIANFKLSGMVRSYDDKTLNNDACLKYSKFAVVLVQINGIFIILRSVTSFSLIDILGAGTVGAAYFFMGKMMKNLNSAAATVEDANV